MSCLYILEINPLVASLANIFSHSVGCLFVLFMFFFFFITHFGRIFHSGVLVYSIGFKAVYTTKGMMSFA